MKKILLTLGVCLTVNMAFAQEDIPDLKKEKIEKQPAFNLVKQYAKLVSCDSSFDQKNDSELFKTTINDVLTIHPPLVTEENNLSTSTYYVVWQGNKGCLFANNAASTHSYFVTEVSSTYPIFYREKTLFINTGNADDGHNKTLDDAFEFEKNEIIRFSIERISKVENGVYDIFNREYVETDISSAPSNLVQTRLKYDSDRGEWMKVFKKVKMD